MNDVTAKLQGSWMVMFFPRCPCFQEKSHWMKWRRTLAESSGLISYRQPSNLPWMAAGFATPFPKAAHSASLVPHSGEQGRSSALVNTKACPACPRRLIIVSVCHLLSFVYSCFIPIYLLPLTNGLSHRLNGYFCIAKRLREGMVAYNNKCVTRPCYIVQCKITTVHSKECTI